MFITSLCHALENAKLDYAVVGGYAVALHGAVRGTVDVDIVLALNEKTFNAAEKIFTSLGLQSRLPVSAREVFQFREEYIKNRQLVAWSFHDPSTPQNQLDVIITEDAKKIKTKTIIIQGIKIKVASLESLIEMKTRSARPQDLEDIKALKEIKLK